MNVSLLVVCYTSKVLSNGENPLMLQINKDGKRNYTTETLLNRKKFKLRTVKEFYKEQISYYEVI